MGMDDEAGINPSQSGVAFLYPLKHQKTFLIFSGGIEKKHRAAMG